MKIESTQKGFTLIELMIVIAIIGILASIAIPQFSAFRVKAFNSAAISDLHGVSLAQEGLFTDYQEYGATQLTGVIGAAAGGIVLTDASASPVIATVTTAGDEMPVTVSSKVNVVGNTNATGSASTALAKHSNGDKAYASESDQPGVFFQNNFVGNSVMVGALAAAASGTDASIPAPAAVTAEIKGNNGWKQL